MRVVFVTQAADPEHPVLGATLPMIRALAARADEVVVIADTVTSDVLPDNCTTRSFAAPSQSARGARYIAALAPDVRDYDPVLALDGGADGLVAYRTIAADARRLLAPAGRLMVELGRGQEQNVIAIFTTAGLTISGPARKDLGGISRALSASAP